MAEKTVDRTEVLSRVSGLSKDAIRGIWDDVKANSARLQSCARHRFDGDFQIGKRKVCLVCGGGMSLTDIGNYIRGYEAGGGSADDIWPGFTKPKS